MRDLLLLGAAAALLAMPAQAALSGFYDSAAQIETILADARVGDALHQAPIYGLTQGGDRGESVEWLLKSEECTLSVWLIALLPQGGLGKRSYEISKIGQCEK